ncbi:MAG: type II secretion system protein GspL [Betaproteobacteria bacterium]|nr:type II secretion system protein GspL [Betaproteobacteria bacterium]
MSTCRIRVTRDTPASGVFEWVTLDRQGTVLASGDANLEHSPVSGACDLVLASDLVSLDRVVAPPSQQKKLGSALRYLAEDFALADPERLHVASAPGPDRNSMVLATIDRQWLGQLLARLEGAQLAATSAYPESLLPALTPHTWTVVWNGEEGFVRTGQHEVLSLDVPEPKAPPIGLRLALDNARAAGAGPQAIVVRSVMQSAPPDVDAWSAALGVPVERGPAWHWASAQRRPDFELLQGEFAARGGAGSWLQRLRRPALMAAVFFALNSAAIALDWGAKVRERNALMEEMRAVYRESFGAGAVVVDAPLQMRRALADLRKQAGRVGPGDFLPLLSAAAERLQDPARYRVESMSYENAALTVTLRPAAGQQTAALLEELRAKTPPPAIDVRAEAAPASGAIVLMLRPRPGT